MAKQHQVTPPRVLPYQWWCVLSYMNAGDDVAQRTLADGADSNRRSRRSPWTRRGGVEDESDLSFALLYVYKRDLARGQDSPHGS